MLVAMPLAAACQVHESLSCLYCSYLPGCHLKGYHCHDCYCCFPYYLLQKCLLDLLCCCGLEILYQLVQLPVLDCLLWLHQHLMQHLHLLQCLLRVRQEAAVHVSQALFVQVTVLLTGLLLLLQMRTMRLPHPLQGSVSC